MELYKKELQEYRVKSQNDMEDLNDINLISYEVSTNKILNLCDTVSFKERNLYVYKCRIEIVNEAILGKYILRDEKGVILTSPKK